MTQEEINKAFEGRWRIKSQNLDKALEAMLIEYRIDYVKKLCRDFFETGIIISTKNFFSSSVHVIPCEYPASDDEAFCIEFETFWAAYDKKVGKPKCIKLWDKLTIKEKKDCLDYIPLYKQAQPDKQYRKNPETFLRNKSWNDELIYRNNGTEQPTIEQQRLHKLASILTDQ